MVSVTPEDMYWCDKVTLALKSHALMDRVILSMSMRWIIKKLIMEMNNMDLKTKSTKELKTLLKQFSIVSLGLKDLIIKQMIEDELQWRKNHA
jgi:hypothetical protein